MSAIEVLLQQQWRKAGIEVDVKNMPASLIAGADGVYRTGNFDIVLDGFANGVDPAKAKELYAVQWPTAASIFAGRTTVAAWRSKPSWYAVSKDDQTINPDLERFLAKRMNATTVELDAGHLSLVSHAREVADLILAAAGRPKS